MIAPQDALRQFVTGVYTQVKRQQGIDAYITDPRLTALHEQLFMFDPHQSHKMPLAETRFVVMDTETTGLHAYSGDEIISISLLEMQGLKLTGEEYHTYINPNRPIPLESTCIHGLCDRDVADSPCMLDVLPDIGEFIGECILVGHHINFDIRFLNKTLQRHVLCTLRHSWVDTMLLFSALNGCLGHYSLDEVANRCHVKNPARHTAYGDAMTTALIFQDLVLHLTRLDKPIQDLLQKQYELGHF